MGYKRVPLFSVPESPAVRGYLAGLVDGEGCIGFSPCFDKVYSKSMSYSAKVEIANTSKTLMDWLGKTLGGSVSLRGDRPAGWKHTYTWTVRSENLDTLLEAILPYLIIKKAQAELVLEFRKQQKRHGRRGFTPEQLIEREATVARLHELNARGLPPTPN